MQNKQRGIFDMIEVYIDMLINLLAMFMAYFFNIMIFEEAVVDVTSPKILISMFACVFISSFVYHIFNMYSPSRYRSEHGSSLYSSLKVNAVVYGIFIIAATFFIASYQRRRMFVFVWILLAAFISTVLVGFKIHLIKNILTAFRKKQYNLRRIIVVGDNTSSAEEYIRQVTENNTKYGAMVLGYVGDKIVGDIGAEKLGPFTKFAEILDKYKPTDVVFAIDAYDKRHLIRLVNMCDDRCIKIYFLPVIYGFFKNPRQIEQVGSIPLINVHSTPLDNRANASMKRALDIVGSLFLIILTSPLMLFAAIGTKIASPGPVLFKQTRVGKMGKPFTMLKFRSMRCENNTGTEWTTDTDNRKTKFGNFLRKTSIDELPQLFNVLIGTMSLVGPRPEMPNFVEHFKEVIPLYMVKHYVKPGMTGLAQIKGLRGDTSVEDRIHEDIEYIENWTFFMDIAILLKTPAKAINKNERYVEREMQGTALDDELTRTFKTKG